RTAPAIVTWNGGGGDFNWNNALNWSTNALPTSTDDVVIDVPGTITVTQGSGTTQIRSVTCQENLAITGGSFRVTAGASNVNGDFSVSGNATLTAQGGGVSFAANSTTTITGATLQAFSGANLNLSHATSFTGGSGSTITANGPGTLNLSG